MSSGEEDIQPENTATDAAEDEVWNDNEFRQLHWISSHHTSDKLPENKHENFHTVQIQVVEIREVDKATAIQCVRRTLGSHRSA